MSAPAVDNVLTRLGRPRLAVGIALAGSIAVFATSFAAWTEPDARDAPRLTTTLPAAEQQQDVQCHPAGPTWTLVADPVERIGYRSGRRHVFEVVPLGPTGIEVEVKTARAFLAMQAAAARACVNLRLESGFRTLEEQRELFRAWRTGRGNKAARPGQSNHQSGRALDISVLSVPGALAWLETNAASFGFKRTVKNEPWHWEYVDAAIAYAPPTKRVVRKAIKPAKVVSTTRPAKRPKSIGTASRPSRRLASSRR